MDTSLSKYYFRKYILSHIKNQDKKNLIESVQCTQSLQGVHKMAKRILQKRQRQRDLFKQTKKGRKKRPKKITALAVIFLAC